MKKTTNCFIVLFLVLGCFSNLRAASFKGILTALFVASCARGENNSEENCCDVKRSLGTLASEDCFTERQFAQAFKSTAWNLKKPEERAIAQYFRDQFAHNSRDLVDECSNRLKRFNRE